MLMVEGEIITYSRPLKKKLKSNKKLSKILSNDSTHKIIETLQQFAKKKKTILIIVKFCT